MSHGTCRLEIALVGVMTVVAVMIAVGAVTAAGDGGVVEVAMNMVEVAAPTTGVSDVSILA